MSRVQLSINVSDFGAAPHCSAVYARPLPMPHDPVTGQQRPRHYLGRYECILVSRFDAYPHERGVVQTAKE
jgi:hypothetical protein